MRVSIAIFLAAFGQMTWASHTCNPYPPQHPAPCVCKVPSPSDVTCYDNGVAANSPLNLQLPSQHISGDLSGIPSSFLLPPQPSKPLLPATPCPTSYPVWPQPDEKCFRHIPVIQKYRNSLVETRTRHVPIIKKRFRTVVEPYTTHVPVLEKFCHPVEETVVRTVPVFDRNFNSFFPTHQPSHEPIKFPSSASASPSHAFALAALPPSVTSSSCMLPSAPCSHPQPVPRPIALPAPISSPCGCSAYPSQSPCVFSY